MTGKTHRIIGIAAGLTYLVASAEPEYSPATLGFVVAGSYIASLIPDMDRPAADIWNTLPFGRTIGEIVDPFFKHRNISHSLLGLGIFGFGIYVLLGSFPDYWGIDTDIVLTASLIAMGTHLIADMFTVEGIPLLYPWHRMLGIPPKPLDGIRILTGKWFENLVIFPIVNLWLVITVIVKWDIIKSMLLK